MLDEKGSNEIDDLIRRTTQMDAPVEVEDRLRRRLAEFRTRVEQRPPSRWGALAASLDSLVRAPRVRVLVIAAAVLLAVAVGLVLNPIGFGTGRVYAAAAQRLAGAQSLEYTVVLKDRKSVV